MENLEQLCILAIIAQCTGHIVEGGTIILRDPCSINAGEVKCLSNRGKNALYFLAG